MIDVPHVLLDCTAIPAHRGGVGRYVEGLLRGFESSQVRLTLATQARDRDAFVELVPWANIHSLPPRFTRRPLRIAWEQFSMPGFARRLGVDIIHSPHYTYPLLWRGGRVVTIHDATFFSDPGMHRPLKRLFFRTWTKLSWHHADAVITPSAATAGEVERFIGKPVAHVEVALHGVDSGRFHKPTPTQLTTFRRELGLTPDATWFAFLGTIEPRKNVVALLDAYRSLRDELGDAAPQLLLSGGRGWDKEALARLDALGDDSGVRKFGYLPLEHLPALLGGSIAVLYPSSGEGFGLPVLEAMACGAAVITTDRLAIPEVGGDAVVYAQVDPPSIAAAMRDLLHDGAKRDRLRELAFARAALFTWHATASSHVDAYLSSVRPVRA